MRISKAALLVVIAFTVPILVELRTVLAWVNVELTVLESVTLGVAMILAILVWALWPKRRERPLEYPVTGYQVSIRPDRTSSTQPSQSGCPSS